MVLKAQEDLKMRPVPLRWDARRFFILRAEVKEVLASYGAVIEESESVAWEEVYPDFNGIVALRGARKMEALTQKELARLVGVSQTHISEMEHSKRPIGKDMARRLATVLKANYRVFL
jgi:DNA-binding XRE family transcriptional regulator